MKKGMHSLGSIYTVTLGTKGQIVIPKEAREMMDISPGDKLMMIAKDDHLMCLPMEHMQQFIEIINSQLHTQQK